MSRTYGKIHYKKEKNVWVIESLEPHVSIKAKKIFPKIPHHSIPPYHILNSSEICTDLDWFMDRYPLEISDKDKKLLKNGSKSYKEQQSEVERILLPNYKPKKINGVKKGFEIRNHQSIAVQMHDIVKRLLLVDAIGTGKTYTAIGSALNKDSLPAAFVVQAHLPTQFKEKINQFSDLKVHIIKTGKPYNLPKADVYIFKYTILKGWVDIFAQRFFKMVVFDEVQELRHGDSTSKGHASKILSENVDKVLATTATPMYGYGIEIFNVLNIIKPHCLGTKGEFVREWCDGNEKSVKDPNALGSFLRESQLMLRRSKLDIYGDSSKTNIIVEKVDYDEKSVASSEELAKQLAITALTGSPLEQGTAARALDLKLRQATGIAKAKNVAMFVRMLVESNEKVILSGWHRDVYEIWQKELGDLGLVMYTGSETPLEKERSKDLFINGNANIIVISHKSGAGLDGLQHVCSTVVLGELAWSHELHNQIIGRADRDGKINPVTAFIMISDYGSDPVMMDLLGLKYNQQKGILNPDNKVEKVNNDKSRLKDLARMYLKNKNITVEEK